MTRRLPHPVDLKYRHRSRRQFAPVKVLRCRQALVYPTTFRTEEVATNGTTIHVRIGGSGPAVVLLHGYGETGDMWAPLAAELMQDHTVIAPDLRGMGLSAVATEGFTKKNEAEDVAGVLDALHIQQADVVGHDIGNMVAFAFAESHPDRTTRLVMMDAPVPGVGPWDEILKTPILWHFHFGGPDMERLVAGRERIYLDRFWNDFSADPAHTRIAAHTHRDNRTALVVSGEWHFGYGEKAAEKETTTLGPGGFYTEPAGVAHFAFTGDAPSVVYITGQGPSDTQYVSAADDPSKK
ncbi:alpha/beta fold hydrolase [Rhizobium jaguaris]|uniref:alpha/beta fold hydrolase n=1 Tax=Rhizobium jaguaris TaxID=1312183 RepID=UPI0039BF16D8